MDNNKFFRAIWRFNGLLLSAACLLFAGRWVYERLRPLDPRMYFGNNASASLEYQGHIREAKWRFEDPREIGGSPSRVVPLRLVGFKDASTESTVRNLLFTNTRAGSTWLLPDNRREILAWEPVQKPGESKVAALCYVIRSDAGVDVFVSAPDGTGFTKALSGVVRVVQMSGGNDDDIVVFFVRNEQLLVAHIPIADPAHAQTLELPHVISD